MTHITRFENFVEIVTRLLVSVTGSASKAITDVRLHILHVPVSFPVA